MSKASDNATFAIKLSSPSELSWHYGMLSSSSSATGASKGKDPQEKWYLKMDLKSNPGKSMSETYSINIPYFSHGLPYEWILFLKTFEKVVKGQNLTSAAAKFTMMRMLL